MDSYTWTHRCCSTSNGLQTAALHGHWMQFSRPLYGYTTWTLTKRLKKKLDGKNTRMLRTILNRSWQQHPTLHQLYGHLPPIPKTIQARRTRHAGRPARAFIQQLCDDTMCNPEDLPKAMNDRETWRERVRDIRASCTSWWWWWPTMLANRDGWWERERGSRESVQSA